MYFHLLLKAGCVLSLSCLGFVGARESIWQDGKQEVEEGLCLGLCFPLEQPSRALEQPQANHGLTFNSNCTKVGTSWAWYLHLHIFCQRALSLFHYLRAPGEHMLMQRKWLSKQKGHSELEPWSRENLQFAGFNSGKRRTLPALGAAAVLLVQSAVGLDGSVPVPTQDIPGVGVLSRHSSECVSNCVRTGMCPCAPLPSAIQGIGPLQAGVAPWWNYPDLLFCRAESCLSA